MNTFDANKLAAMVVRHTAQEWIDRGCLGFGLELQEIADKLDPPAPPESRCTSGFEVGQWVRTSDFPGRVGQVTGYCQRGLYVTFVGSIDSVFRGASDISPWFPPGTLVIANRRLGVLNHRGVVISADKYAHVEDQDADWKELDLTELCGWVSSRDCSAAMLVQAWAKRIYGQPAAEGQE